ncbi:hypothetical protein chiPu_0023185, partial [Chiloscyllium punctatum]|nr:hypothetical protein [Chiloscyllium punctatum]
MVGVKPVLWCVRLSLWCLLLVTLPGSLLVLLVLLGKLKVQVWQLLKGHHHLQDEFSLFFESLRPPSSRMSDFEEVNWTEDKEYEFDGFEEVVLPDLEDDEEIQKMAPLPRNKKRRECHPHEKSLDSKTSKGKDSGNVLEAWSPQPGNKDSGKASDLVEDDLEQKEDPHTPDPSKAELAVSAGAS